MQKFLVHLPLIIVSQKKSAAIKGIKNTVAGQADVLLVPNVETGNSLVKMMIYFMGACASWCCSGWKGTNSNN